MAQKYINKYTILQDVTMEYAHRTLYRIKALQVNLTKTTHSITKM